jgi:dynein intermediate chain 2
MKQNNTVNIYEEYFEGLEADHCSEPPFAKGLAVFRDPSQITRTATSVNWHPEGSSNGRLAVSYAVLNFQDERLMSPNMSVSVSHLLFSAGSHACLFSAGHISHELWPIQHSMS